MNSAQFTCYYCGFNNTSINTLFQHLTTDHKENQIKFKQYMMCHTSGTIELKTKTFPIIPSQLEENESLQFDIATNKVKVIKQTIGETCPASPQRKKAKQNTFQGARADSNDADIQKLNDILPNILETLRNSNLLHEYMQFNKMLADKTFPLDNISFLMFIELVRWKSMNGRYIGLYTKSITLQK